MADATTDNKGKDLQDAKKTTSMAFSFGDPMPVLDKTEILDYMHSSWSGRWYEPPVSWSGLAKSYRAGPHHASAIQLKRNILLKTFNPHPKLGRAAFGRGVLDHLVFGNLFFEEVESRIGGVHSYKHAMTKYTRVGKDDNYWWVPSFGKEVEFESRVFHLMEPDINQEIYGLPQYLGALHSAWLNENATLFRRKYYLNGSHAGYILSITDSSIDPDDLESVRTAMKESKGPGNFRNFLMYTPSGKPDGIKVIPMAEVQAKDEFFNIKNITRDDLLSAHRTPWQMMSMPPPMNTGSSGSPKDVAQVFAANEIEPLQQQLMEFNEWAGDEIITFRPYTIEDLEAAKNEATSRT